MAAEKQTVWVKPVQYVQGAISAGRSILGHEKKNPDEFLQRAIAEWPLFDQLIARLYVDYQKAVDRVDVASIEGLASKDREIGFMAAHQRLLAWFTKFAKSGRATRRARKG